MQQTCLLVKRYEKYHSYMQKRDEVFDVFDNESSRGLSMRPNNPSSNDHDPGTSFVDGSPCYNLDSKYVGKPLRKIYTSNQTFWLEIFFLSFVSALWEV